MRKFTDAERIYLRIACEKGYRYIAKDFTGLIYFYKNKPVKVDNKWITKMSDVHDIFESMLDFGTSYEDEEPTRIADLLGIDETDWRQVKPFTHVFVRDSEDEDWTRALFLKYTDEENDERERFDVTYYNKWTDDGSFHTWRYCRLATQEEIDKFYTESNS